MLIDDYIIHYNRLYVFICKLHEKSKDHAKTKDYCMTQFFGHGQSILQVFETPIALSMMKSVKSQFFPDPTGPDFVDFSHMFSCDTFKRLRFPSAAEAIRGERSSRLNRFMQK